MSTKIALIGRPSSKINTSLALLRDRLSKLGWRVILPCEVTANPDENGKTLAVYLFGEGEKVPERATERDAFEGVFVLVEGDEVRKSDRPAVCNWVGHPHLRVVDVSESCEPLLDEVTALLGIPEPREIERKFLIKMPDLKMLSALPECRGVGLSQTYLVLPDGTNARVRRRGEGDDCSYIKTIKKRLTDRTRIEIEQPLSAEEYADLLRYADPIRRSIEKTRYCLVWSNTYFELDVFDFWDREAFLEVELLSEEQEISLPPFLEVLREVTDDPTYSNSALALNVPKQD